MSTLDDMIAKARDVMGRAHAPDSRFHVGCCIRGASGALYAAANVENAAYPQGQCAEASAIGMMVAGGDRRIAEVVVMGGTEGDGALCTPCGGCRQRLREFIAPAAEIHLCARSGARQTTTLEALLPRSFGPEFL
jgi:cytidine deaminase